MNPNKQLKKSQKVLREVVKDLLKFIDKKKDVETLKERVSYIRNLLSEIDSLEKRIKKMNRIQEKIDDLKIERVRYKVVLSGTKNKKTISECRSKIAKFEVEIKALSERLK